MRDAVAQGVACAAGQFQRAAGKGFEFAHGEGLMMTVLAHSLAVAALNRREREARVLNAGSFMHGSQARGPIPSLAAWRGGWRQRSTDCLAPGASGRAPPFSGAPPGRVSPRRCA